MRDETRSVHPPLMEPVPSAVALIGLGAIAAGVVGVLLPPNHRMGAALALVAGAGVGVLMVALGFDTEGGDGGENVLLVASTLGFVTVLAMLALAWRRASVERSGSG